jgi:dTDP-4-dehydrorhamnose 3,5-epimerase
MNSFIAGPVEGGPWIPVRANVGTDVDGMPGALILNDTHKEDERGQFRKPYTVNSLRGDRPAEVFFSSSTVGVVRGMHATENTQLSGKIITVLSGIAYDVLVDLRPGSNFGATVDLELDASSPSLLVPSGVAHGFQALTDFTSILYCVQNCHIPEMERGVNPLSIGVTWPLPVTTISARDSRLPDIASFQENNG